MPTTWEPVHHVAWKRPDPDSPPDWPLSPDLPLGHAQTELKSLLEEFQLRAAYTAELVQNLEARIQEVKAKEDQIRADHARAAEEGDTSLARVKELHDECLAFGDEKRALLDPRIEEARAIALAAAEAYDSYRSLHARELIAELRDEATGVRDEYVEEEARVRQRLARLAAKDDEIASAARHFIAAVREFAVYEVPSDPTELPLPRPRQS